MANNNELVESVGMPKEESSGGLPQLDASAWAPQVVWLILCFVFLYLMMSRVALPRIGSVIEERKDKIADDLDRAAELKKEAEDALAAYEQALQDARSKAHAIAGETHDKVKSETDALRAENDAKLAEELGKAEQRIRETKETAMANVKTVATDTAVAIVDKLIGQSVDEATASSAVDAELSQS